MIDIEQIERNVEELVEVNKRVLTLTTKLQKGTIDRVMEKSDLELVFDFLIFLSPHHRWNCKRAIGITVLGPALHL